MDFKILLVDGSANRRKQMANLLSESGSSVTFCPGSASAIKKLVKEKFDLLLISDRTRDFLPILAAAESADLNIELIFKYMCGSKWTNSWLVSVHSRKIIHPAFL